MTAKGIIMKVLNDYTRLVGDYGTEEEAVPQRDFEGMATYLVEELSEHDLLKDD